MTKNGIGNALNTYVQNPDDAWASFRLGMAYFNEGQTASAVSFFLRAAERTDDNFLAYNALILIGNCFDIQGNRSVSAASYYRHAIAVLPYRPEAFFFLGKVYYHSPQYSQHDTLPFFGAGLKFLNSSLPPLEGVNYPIEDGLRVYDAMVDWYVGRDKESYYKTIQLISTLRSEELKELLTKHLTMMESKLPPMNHKALMERYERACNQPSDINEHLPTLFELAQTCNTITEMGVRTGVSTTAFLAARKKLRSYDIEYCKTVDDMFKEANTLGVDAQYIIADVLTVDIQPTDLLFIDTRHEYDQLTKELERHAPNTKKYLVFHDTETFAVKGEFGGKGLMPAIMEFLMRNPNWRVHLHKQNNNGLTVLKRHD